jgi:TROVE domain
VSRFNVTDRRVVARGPLVTEATPSGVTHEGGAGYKRDAKTELFLRATTTFVGEDAFYETANEGADRLRALVKEVALTADGWEWLKGFLPWLRGDGNVRTASILLAAEAVKVRLDDQKGARVTMLHPGDQLGNRQLITAVCQRADEPGELLAYWLQRFGRPIPKPVKRGLADAAGRLYSERAFLRYDSGARGVRFGDVLELVHARVVVPDGVRDLSWLSTDELEQLTEQEQRAEVRRHVDLYRQRRGDLFRWAITARHDREGAEPPESLRAVRARWELSRLEPHRRHALARSAGSGAVDTAARWLELATASQWEWLLSWLGERPAEGGLSKLEQWRLVLPQLGYMALLRNLRNLDEAGLDDETAATLAARLVDPAEVAKSRQLPFRFYSAYQAAPSLRWGHALDRALQASLANVPTLSGRSLILIDTSGSMQFPMSGKSRLNRVHAAALFGLALALRNPDSVDVYGFAYGEFKVEGLGHAKSLIKAVELFAGQVGRVGHGTDIGGAVQRQYRNQDRVFIFTDMQSVGNPYGDVAAPVPARVPVYGFNLAGYEHSAMPVGHGNRHELGGLTDHTFRLIPLLEAGHRGAWPWLTD